MTKGKKNYIGILDLNKLTLLCCSLGELSFVSMLPCILVNKDIQTKEHCTTPSNNWENMPDFCT